MKCVVLSDSHGNWEYMRQAVERERPDQILHLGDVVRDVPKLAAVIPDIPIAQVVGNCDRYSGSDLPEERELLLAGKRIWMLHGHTWWVKSGTGLLVEEARVRGVDVVCFGHTHQSLCAWDGRMWVLNPGTCQGTPSATYGVIEVENGQVSCRVERLGTESIVRDL